MAALCEGAAHVRKGRTVETDMRASGPKGSSMGAAVITFLVEIGMKENTAADSLTGRVFTSGSMALHMTASIDTAVSWVWARRQAPMNDTRSVECMYNRCLR